MVIPTYEVCSPLGKVFFFPFMAHWGTCADSTHEGVLSTPWENFLHNSRGGYHCALDPLGCPSMILYFTRDLVDDFNSRGSFFRDFYSVEECS